MTLERLDLIVPFGGTQSYTITATNVVVLFRQWQWDDAEGIGPVEVRYAFGPRLESAIVVDRHRKRHVVPRSTIKRIVKAHEPDWSYHVIDEGAHHTPLIAPE